MKILALSGSLRGASLNAALLRATARLASPPLVVVFSTSLGNLPLFNPDLELSPLASVLELRKAVGLAEALVIASPEYAHGISGVMKNALDWLVSYEGFVNKPVALFNASPRAHHAHDALLEVLRTMSANIVEEACVTVPLLGSGLTEEAMARDPAVTATIRRALHALSAAVDPGASRGPSFPVG
jgi:NAD(P)H-dependent FMN reductase